jgi:catechol 2,3-dioxygenase-like lactoylglutathione lyase family enzyme
MTAIVGHPRDGGHGFDARRIRRAGPAGAPTLPPMRLIRIDHVSLDVRDRPASIAWYEEILGLCAGLRHDAPDEPVFIGAATARLGLFAQRPAGLRHIALATDAEGQHEVVRRLDRRRIAHVRESHDDHDSVYFADPDGTMLEVMVARGR